MERTLALIKPDACGRPWVERFMKKEEVEGPDGTPEERWVEVESERAPDKATAIVQRIRSAGFAIADSKVMRLTQSQAEQFYREHRGKPFFDTLTGFMSSGPLMALSLEKENAVKAWRDLMGPTNTFRAREAAEAAHPLDDSHWPLRALFGTDGTRNATHGSDSAFSALRETEFFFPQPPRFERTLLLLLPGVPAGPILESLQVREFVPVAQREVSVPHDLAHAFLGRGHSEALCAALSAGRCTAVVLERLGAVTQLQLAAGPLDGKAVAADKAPDSLNALFAPADGGVAAVAAASADSAATAIAALFGGPLPLEYTLAVIKPETADTHAPAIMHAITQHGFRIAAETRTRISKEQAEQFYEEHRGKPFFERLTTYMSSGDVVALALVKPGAIRSWRALMGPTSTDKARLEAPSSLRARFGLDGTRNATHGSDSPASAAREIRFYFPDLILDPLAVGDAAADFINRHKLTDVYNPVEGGSLPATLKSVLVQGLTELAKAKPAGVDAIRFLGNWLLAHNPRTGLAHEEEATLPVSRAGRVAEPGDEESKTAAPIAEADVLTSAGRSESFVDAELVLVAGGGDSSASGVSSVLLNSQLNFLAEEFGYVRINAEELVQAEIASHSPTGKELERVAGTRSAWPAVPVAALLKKAMKRSGAKRFLVEQFPTTMAEAFALEAAVTQPKFVVVFRRGGGRSGSGAAAGGSAAAAAAAASSSSSSYNPAPGSPEDFYAKIGAVRVVNLPADESPAELSYKVATRPNFVPRVVFVVGGPGSGKSSVCAAVAASVGAVHLSVGDLLRAEAATGSVLGLRIADVMERGDLVPDSVALAVLKSAIARHAATANSFLLDGFPRTLAQSLAFEAEIAAPRFVLHLECPDAVLKARARVRAPSHSHASRRGGGGAAGAAGRRVGGGAAGGATPGGATPGGGAAGGSSAAAAAARAKARAAEVASAKAVVDRQIKAFRTNLADLLNLYSAQALVRTVDATQPFSEVVARVRRLFQPECVFVLGGPGSGKGTQCALLKEAFGYVHLSAGDLLRSEVARASPDGAMINRYIAEGKIVPVHVTLTLLQRAMRASGGERFLIDGYPRELDQALEFERVIGPPTRVLFFDCPEAVMRKRLLKRGETSGRVDDNEAAILKRFHTFIEQSLPVVHEYSKRGLVSNVDATTSVEEVFASARRALAPEVVFVLGGPGSGKGTQCALLKEEFDFVHLSTGDLLRSEVARKTPRGEAADHVMREGGMVSMEVVLELIESGMRNSGKRRFLLDGYPRTMEQLHAFERKFGSPSFVLFFDCPEAVMRKRLLKRGETSGRVDDNEASILKRFHTFVEQSLPVIETYSARRLVRRVSAVPPKAAVFAEARRFFCAELAVLVGASGSGRGEFSMRAGRELGYATIRVVPLLEEEAKKETSRGREIAAALRTRRTTPLDATVAVIKEAVLANPNHRFLLDGFPRLVSEGFPSVHDQVFALEEAVGPIRGCICLDAGLELRRQRIKGAPSIGQEAALIASVDAFRREKLPVVHFFDRLGKTRVIDTTLIPDVVFDTARPFLE